MHTCPYCKQNLGNLDHIMDELAKNKMNGQLFFQSKCCNQRIRAFSDASMYYIEAADQPPDPEMIGAA